MILFTIFSIIVLSIAAIIAAIAITCGAGFVVVFGDVIVFGLGIWLLIKLFRRKN